MKANEPTNHFILSVLLIEYFYPLSSLLMNCNLKFIFETETLLMVGWVRGRIGQLSRDHNG